MFFLRKSHVKEHFRKLPDGTMVHVKAYDDKRKAAQKDISSFRGKAIHIGPDHTTVVSRSGELKTFPHSPDQELSHDQIKAHLNSITNVDENLGKKIFMHQNDIKDYDRFLNDLVQDEKKNPTGEEGPLFTDIKGAEEHLMSSKQKKGQMGGLKGIKQITQELQKKHGKSTTLAKIYDDPTSPLSQYFDDPPSWASDHDKALSQMLKQHGSAALFHGEKATEAKISKIKPPEECPKIPNLSPNFSFLGHQASTLATLSDQERSPISVSMGGGKSIILVSNSLLKMGQGKVKKPMITVPSACLGQMAAQVHEYTDGSVNAFVISPDNLKSHYEGDISRMVEDIKRAPPNTIFVTSYDTLTRKEKGSDDFHIAKALAGVIDMLSCDESHNFKNEDSSKFKAMSEFSHIKHRVAASGTFLSNNPEDTYGQMKFLYPEWDMTLPKFRKKYGRVETKDGVTWNNLKELKEDLEGMGMINLSTSAWVDKLTKRNESSSVTKMGKIQKAVYNAVLNDVLDDLQEEAKSNPHVKKILEGGQLDSEDDIPPSALQKLNLISGVTDYPHELAEMIEAKEVAAQKLHSGAPMDDETMAMAESFKSLSPSTIKAVKALKGTVSPKAQDIYKTLEEHFKNPENGKYIVFMQKKASAHHVLNNMPDRLKQHAMYFDASQKKNLSKFTKDENGPKILIACDPSIKDGVNMQIANGLSRYDTYFAPGSSEQSICRVDRFGQKKETFIKHHVMDESMDVTKYCRLQAKSYQNQQVLSDLPEDETAAFRLSLDSIRNQNTKDLIPEYEKLRKKIEDFKYEDNKKLKKKFGDGKTYARSGTPIKGESMHGRGPYLQSEVQKIKKSLVIHMARKNAPKDAARLMVNIGKKRMQTVADLVEYALKKRMKPKKLAEILKKKAGGKNDQGRDWLRVAVTELTRARARASLEILQNTYGKDVVVYRLSAQNCCPKCRDLWGVPGKYRYWKASKIPEHAKGAVHPRCFLKGHEIQTLKGLKNIEDVVPNDIVFSALGRSKNVKKVLASDYDGKINTLKTSIGSSITGTHDHPMIKNGQWYELSLMNEGDKILESITLNVAFKKIYDCPTVNGKIVQFFGILSGFLFGSMEIPTMNLDGNFVSSNIKGHVDIITPDGFEG